MRRVTGAGFGCNYSQGLGLNSGSRAPDVQGSHLPAPVAGKLVLRSRGKMQLLVSD